MHSISNQFHTRASSKRIGHSIVDFSKGIICNGFGGGSIRNVCKFIAPWLLYRPRSRCALRLSIHNFCLYKDYIVSPQWIPRDFLCLQQSDSSPIVGETLAYIWWWRWRDWSDSSLVALTGSFALSSFHFYIFKTLLFMRNWKRLKLI